MTEQIASEQKAAIIAIGTEVTSGEIHNANAATIAARLTDLGFNCDLHLAVPDDRSLMMWALESAVNNRDLVIITGGLGPTSDDFTREVLAEFLHSDLQWNESAWQTIVRRLNQVGAPIADSNKRQAYFPACATIHPNHHGTAAAFSAKFKQTMLIALPGPPKEIDGLWNDHFQSLISTIAPAAKSQKPLRWICLGQSESKLGEIVEENLQGSGFLTGYRARMPYIDIKVWVPASRSEEFDSRWRQRLESAIDRWLVGRDDDDAGKNLLSALSSLTLCVIDGATGGYLANRLCSLRTKTAEDNLTVITSKNLSLLKVPFDADVIAQLTSNTETGEWHLKLTAANTSKSYTETSRYKGPSNAERLSAYIAEKSIVIIKNWLTEM